MDKLVKYNQEHIFREINDLSENEIKSLKKQIEDVDFSYLDELNKTKQNTSKACISPIEAMTIDEINLKKDKFERVGIDALKRGEVGAVLLAGGMGTRLGSDDPKGMYNIGVSKKLYIFECLFNNIMSVVQKTKAFIPLFIMTSDKTDKKTREFLKEKNYFGYNPKYIRFFMQDVAPCTDFNGKILMEAKDRIATSPNGNGGWFNSILKDESAAMFLKNSNVKWLNVFAVDNVLQKICDPVFVGATILSGAGIGAKVIKKANPFEKVGVMCRKNKKPSIVEYIDLSEEMALKTDKNGNYLYNYGVILNYLFNLDLLNKTKDERLPVHIVKKKIPYVDENGVPINPSEQNGYKFEILCVDMVELADDCLVFEVEREKEFAPIKNMQGIDSVVTARELLIKNGINI